MAKPPSSPSATSRPAIPDRAVTAPELAAALNEVSVLDHRRQFSMVEDAERNGIDGLGGQRSNSTRTLALSRTITNSFRQRIPSAARWRIYLMQEVAKDRYLEFQLLLMTVATGCLDVMTYQVYRVFTSKQTGNTLFLATYALDRGSLEPGFELNVGISMTMFIAGAVISGHLGHYSKQRRRIWLLATSLFQLLLILGAAAIRFWVSREPTGRGAIGILALLAFAMSGQITTALHVGMPDVNTTMITGAIVSLCTEKNIFKLRAPRRDRLLAFCAAMVIGCFIGATILHFSTPSAALVTVACTKGVIMFTFLFNRGLVKTRRSEEDGNRQNGEKQRAGAVTPVTRILWGD